MLCEFYTPRDFIFRKVTDSADARMRMRTAKEQHAAMLEALRGPDEIPPSDADDESLSRKGVLS